MATRSLSRDESLGLALALAGHAALVAWLIWQRAPAPPPIPERMSVTITDQTGPVSAAPIVQPEEAAPDTAPVLGEAPPPPLPQPQVATPQPQKPSPSAAPPKPPAKPATPQTPPRPTKQPGGSAFDSAFANGVPKSAGKAKTPPSSVASAQQKAAWNSSIGGKVAARLRGCGVTGLDIGNLYINVHFTLEVDGTIQTIEDATVQGITPANRSQAAPFKACVYRAIRLAAPFGGLPPDYYSAWKERNMHLSLQEH